ncbi:hypothetical protein KBC03_06185 [Patescibacteria group bacterium]|nr:hypothetical protein [Patescibacteria group bacterium]
MNILKIKAFRHLSFLKLLIGATLLCVAFFTINVYEDPGIGIAMILFGMFFLARGASFFLFMLLQNLFHKFPLSEQKKEKESYKLSLLFGLYILINIILLILEKRSKRNGLMLLMVFVIGQVILFVEPRNDKK